MSWSWRQLDEKIVQCYRYNWKVFNAAITDTLWAVPKVGDARSAACHSVSTHCLNSLAYYHYPLGPSRSWLCSFCPTLHCRNTPSGLMNFLPLRSAFFIELSMLLLPNAASWIYAVLSFRVFQGVLLPVKYGDGLQAAFWGMWDNGITGPGPYELNYMT